LELIGDGHLIFEWTPGHVLCLHWWSPPFAKQFVH
jgi:hypothetical protein